jgi:DNA-binding NarL/FixJ family response regulator
MFPPSTDDTEKPPSIRILLIDRHPITLLGLNALFADRAGCVVVDALNSVDNVTERVKLLQPDVVLMDIRMENAECVKLVRDIFVAGVSTTKVIILTAALNENETCELIKCGVKGILLKEMRPELIVQCVRKVYDGGEWLERRSMALAFESIMRREANTESIAKLLTPRELELAILIASGCCNRTASQQLFIGEGTVRVYLNRIYSKLNVTSRLQLALYLKEKGLV